MKDSKTLALTGAALLFVGVFLPLVSLPVVGNMNYVQNGRGDGIFILVLALVTALLTLAGRTRHVLWTGLLSLGIMTYTFINFQSVMAEARESMETDLAGNPFRGLAEIAMQSIQIQWGWAVLVLGAVIVAFAGWKAREEVTSIDGHEEAAQ